MPSKTNPKIRQKCIEIGYISNQQANGLNYTFAKSLCFLDNNRFNIYFKLVLSQ